MTRIFVGDYFPVAVVVVVVVAAVVVVVVVVVLYFCWKETITETSGHFWCQFENSVGGKCESQ